MKRKCAVCGISLAGRHWNAVVCSAACKLDRKNELGLQWLARNREKVRAHHRAKRAKNPELYNELSRKWRARNREKVNAGNRRWRQNNPEKWEAIWRAWHDKPENKASIREAHARWRSKNFKKRQEYARQYQADPKNRAVRTSQQRERVKKERIILRAVRELELI